MGPLTLMVYVPVVVKLSKSRAYTSGYPELHDPRFAPMAAGPNTVDPLEFFTANVAPVSADEDIKYARFVPPAT
jgi:hypothetical protein